MKDRQEVPKLDCGIVPKFHHRNLAFIDYTRVARASEPRRDAGPRAPAAMEQKSLLTREQDETIDVLGAGVQRVKALAGVMRNELAEQAVILDDLESEVDKTDGSMQSMNKKLRGLVEQAKGSDRALYGVIAALVVLLVVLVFMALE